MSLIVEIVFELFVGLLYPLFARVFHATGRRAIFLLTLGFVRIPSLRHGGADGEFWADFGVECMGFLFWLAALALTIYLALP